MKKNTYNLEITPTTRINEAHYKRNTEQRGDCLIWTGAKHRQGYGMLNVMFNGLRRIMTAHRIAAMMFHKRDFDVKEFIIHTCGCNECVNPEHLKIGSRADIKTIKYPKTRSSPKSKKSELVV